MDKLHPRAVIFDLGSTLIEYERIPWDEMGDLCVENGRKALIDNGHEVPGKDEFVEHYYSLRDDYRQRARETHEEWNVPELVAEIFDRIGLESREEMIDLFYEAYYDVVRKQLYVYDDTVSTLETLKPHYPVMGLISNTIFPEWSHEEELKRFGIEPFIDFTIYSSSFKHRKPHPSIFQHAANLAGFAPSECVYVGDRYLEDIQGPTSVGMPAILKIKPGREYPDDMPDDLRRIDKLSELTNHLVV